MLTFLLTLADLRNDKSRAYNAFLTSLKHNPNYAASYTGLGIYFADIVQENERAGKCFHKAFELDASEAEAARRLTETFANDRDWELVEVIATRFAEAEKRRCVPGKESTWPYRVLGVAYLVCFCQFSIFLLVLIYVHSAIT